MSYTLSDFFTISIQNDIVYFYQNGIIIGNINGVNNQVYKINLILFHGEDTVKNISFEYLSSGISGQSPTTLIVNTGNPVISLPSIFILNNNGDIVSTLQYLNLKC